MDAHHESTCALLADTGLTHATISPLRASPLRFSKLQFAGGITAQDGADVSRAQGAQPPTVMQVSPAAELAGFVTPGSSFILLLADPDAPSAASPKFRFWLHWLCPATVDARGYVKPDMAAAPVAYEGPTPPPGKGVHRYLLVRCVIQPSTEDSTPSRCTPLTPPSQFLFQAPPNALAGFKAPAKRASFDVEVRQEAEVVPDSVPSYCSARSCKTEELSLPPPPLLVVCAPAPAEACRGGALYEHRTAVRGGRGGDGLPRSTRLASI